VSIEDFLNEEMRLYSIDSCRRGIPCILDGLKESTRKILSACFKRRLNYNRDVLKVAQLGGYVSEHMGYHHGEQNLPDIIVGMAQSFPGSNNLPLLYAGSVGFGTRQGGTAKMVVGKDAADGRYIFTKLEMLTRLIFRPEDDPYLPDRVEDGETLEKLYYMPIIPMILVNGCAGIGTGSSTQIPMYNLFELIDWILVWLDKKGEIQSETNGLVFYETPELCPYYRGFEGKIEQDGTRVTTYGNLTEIKEDTWQVTELPLGRLNCSIKKYRAKLEKMREDKQIKSIRSQKGDENKPDFTITVDEDGIKPNLKNMKLVDTLSTANMVLFDENLKLHRYATIESILTYFCQKRYAFYQIRKDGDLVSLRLELQWTSNKLRFIRMVDKGDLVILDRDEAELDKQLGKLGFDRKPKGKRGKKTVAVDSKDEADEPEDGEDDEVDDTLTFDYLLSMQARTLNIRSRVFKLLEKQHTTLQEQLEALEKTTIDEMWKRELGELKETHKKWEKRMAEDAAEPPKKRAKRMRDREPKRHVAHEGNDREDALLDA
jgi:DNA topoisomerase-2